MQVATVRWRKRNEGVFVILALLNTYFFFVGTLWAVQEKTYAIWGLQVGNRVGIYNMSKIIRTHKML